MTGKTQDTEFRDPEAVAILKGLTDEAAAKHAVLFREQDGVVTQQGREGGEVEASGRRPSEMKALLAATESEFGRLLPRLKAELGGGGVPNLDACLKPHHERNDAVAACIDYFDANNDRMRYDLYRQRGLPVGSGVVESACKQIVGSRFKRTGCRWSKAGANVLLAVKRCLENNRWADFLEWSAGRVAATYP